MNMIVQKVSLADALESVTGSGASSSAAPAAASSSTADKPGPCADTPPLPKKLERLHPDDKQDLANMLRQSSERNMGTGSRLTFLPSGTAKASAAKASDLLSAVTEAVATDTVQVEDAQQIQESPDWRGDSGSEEEKETEKVEKTTISGVTDNSFSDGRAPTEAGWDFKSLPEMVSEDAWGYLVRKRRRLSLAEPRVDMSLFKRLAWTLQDAYMGRGERGG